MSILGQNCYCQLDLHSIGVNSFVERDENDLLWISSLDALNRYNGVSTEKFILNKIEGLLGSVIQSQLFLDNNHNYWFSSFEYLIKYDTRLNVFESIQLEIKNELIDEGYHVFHIDNGTSELYLIADGRIIIYNFLSQKVVATLNKPSSSMRFEVFKDVDANTSIIYGFPWLLDYGFEVIQYSDSKLTYVGDFLKEERFTIRDGIFYQSKLWLIANVGLLEVEIEDPNVFDVYVPATASDWTPFHLKRIKNSIFITSRDMGLWQFEIDQSQFINNWTIKDGLLSNSPVEIDVDSFSNFWLSHRGLGVQQLNIREESKVAIINGTEKLSIKSIIPVDSLIFALISRSQGIKKMDLHGREIGEILEPELINNSIIDAVKKKDGRLLIVSEKDYLSIDLETLKIDFQAKIDSGQFFFIEPSMNKNYYVTSSEGLYFQADYQVLIKDTICDFEYMTLYSDFDLFKLIVAYNNDIYICTDETLELVGNIGFPIQIGNIQNQNLYLASTEGLFKLSDTKLTHLSEESKKIGKINGFERVNESSVWFSSNQSIYFFDGGEITRIPKDLNVEFEECAPILLSDKILFATNKGVLTIDNDIYKHYQEIPHTYVMEVHVNGLKYDSPLNPDYIENMDLTWQENDLNFRTEVGEYTGDRHQSIKYMLTGHDKDWNHSTDFNITYKNLQPGNYTLEMIGIGSNLRESDPKIIEISISAPYYQTWWFRGAVAGGLVLIGFGINYYRSQKKLRAQEVIIEKQKALQNQRNRMAQDLHDEMGSGLTTIKYISNALKKESDSDKIEQIENTSTNLIGSMRDLLWSLDESNDTLGSLVSKSRIIIHQMCKNTNLEFKIKADLNPETALPGIYRRNIILILKEAITNVIKHANASNIDVSFSLKEDNLSIQISDDGIGFLESISTQEKSYGLKSIENRIKEMHGRCDIMSDRGGTLIKIKIPLNN